MEEVRVPMSVFVRNLLAWEVEQEAQVAQMQIDRRDDY